MTKNLIRIAGLLSVVAIIAASIFFLKSGKKSDRPKSENERMQEVLTADRENLTSEKSKEHQIYGALVRLAQLKKDPEALAQALKYMNSKSPQLRKASAIALGHFKTKPSTEGLEKLMNDSNQTVRASAILALATNPIAERKALLQKTFQQRTKLTPSETVDLYTALIRTTSDETKKISYFNQLANMALTSEEPHSSLAALRLSRMGTNLEVTTDTFRKVISNNKSSERLTEVAIRHLSTKRDSWIKQQLARLFDHNSARIRMAVIQTLHHACPDERWDILKRAIIGERDRQVTSAAVQQFFYMPGQEAKNLLSEIINSPNTPPEAVKLANEAKKQEAASKRANPCL